MKKTILFLLALAMCFAGFAQGDAPRYSKVQGFGFIYKRWVSDSITIVPLSTSPHVPYREGGLRWDIVNKSLQGFNGTDWLDFRANQINDTSFVFGKDTIRIKGTGSAGGGGSVTLVNTGWGVMGGPISSTGTILADSATLSGYYLRRKDSLVSYVTPNNLKDSTTLLRTLIGSGGADVTKAYVDSLDAYWKRRVVGQLWNDKFNRGSLGSNYSETSPNADIALDGQKMTFQSATVNNYTDWVEYTDKYFNWNRGRVDIKFQINSVIAGNSGFALGWNTQAAGSLNNNFQCRFLTFISGTDTLGRLDFMSNGTAIKTGSTAFPYSKNDTLVMSITRQDNTFYFTVRNLSRNGLLSALTEFYTFPLNIGGYTYSPPNISRLRLFSLGGNQSFFEFSAHSHAKKYPQLGFIGDSETIGIGTTANRNGFPFWASWESDQIAIHAGGFERTADAQLRIPDILLTRPVYVFICLGVNDGGAGVSPSTFQTNLDNIVVAVQSYGGIAVLATMIPTLNNNTTETNYNTAVNSVATARGCQVVQVYNSALNDGSGGLAAAYDGGDDIHLSDAGAQYMGSLLHPFLPLDSSYAKTVHVAKADTIPDGMYDWGIIGLDGRLGKLKYSRLNLQTISTIGNFTDRAIDIQKAVTTTAANQLSVGHWGMASGAASTGWLMHNIRLQSGAFQHIAPGGATLIQPSGSSLLFNTIASGTANTNVTGPQIHGNLRMDNNGDNFWGNMGVSGTTGALTQMMSNGHWLWGMGPDNAYLNLNHTSFNLMDFNTSFATGGFLSIRQGNTIYGRLGIGSATTIGAALSDLSVRSDTVHISDGLGNKQATFAGNELRVGAPGVDKGDFKLQVTGGSLLDGPVKINGLTTGAGTDSVVTIKDGIVKQVASSTFGSPAIPQYLIPFGNASNAQITSPALRYIDSNKAVVAQKFLASSLVKAGDSAYSNKPTKRAFFFGNSITAGSTTPLYLRPTTRIANALNLIEVNYGIGGTRMVQITPGDSAMEARRFLIPTYDANTMDLLAFGYGTNDWRNTSVDSATFRAEYNETLDTAILLRGWPASKILVITAGFSGISNPTTQLRNKQFVDITKDLARKKGVKYSDSYAAMELIGLRTGLQIVSGDSVHLNEQGTEAWARAALDSLGSTSGDIRANGHLYAQQLHMKSYQYGATQSAVDTAHRLWYEVKGNGGGDAFSANLAVGPNAMDSLTTGTNNLYYGSRTGISVTTGSFNTGSGYSTLGSNKTGNYNTAYGHSAAAKITGSNNTAIGAWAAQNSEADDIVAVGYQALRINSTGIRNVAIGSSSLFSSTTASNNVAIGYQSQYQNTTGGGNVSLGFSSLYGNTTGTGNVAIGFQALLTSTASIGNTAIGNNAMRLANSSSSFNAAIGFGSAEVGTSAVRNSFLGAYTGRVMTTGSYNVAVGYQALDSTQAGSHNTSVGYVSLWNLQTGSNNIAIGDSAANNIRTGSNNVVIGNYRFPANTTINKSLTVADGEGMLWLRGDSEGKIGIGTDAPLQRLHVKGKVQIDTVSTGSLSDSTLVISGGEVKKIKPVVLDFGKYTPTSTIISNLDAVTVEQMNYSRVGDIVTVSGGVIIDPTAIATSSAFNLSLPIGISGGGPLSRVAGAFTSVELECGTISFVGGSVAQFQYYPTGTVSKRFTFTFQYYIQ